MNTFSRAVLTFLECLLAFLKHLMNPLPRREVTKAPLCAISTASKRCCTHPVVKSHSFFLRHRCLSSDAMGALVDLFSETSREQCRLCWMQTYPVCWFAGLLVCSLVNDLSDYVYSLQCVSRLLVHMCVDQCYAPLWP